MILFKQIICSSIFAMIISLHQNEFVVTQKDVTKSLTAMPIEKEILVLINEHRRSIGLSALTMMDEVTEQAIKHSREMANETVSFGHEGFDNRIANIRKKVGVIYAWAENVASGQTSAQQVVEDWLNSPGHKKNIEGNYNYTGIGVVTDKEGTTYFTQIFIQK